MFRTNLAQNGLLFPKNHPYYTGVPKQELKRAMQYLPEEYAYRTKKGYEEHAMLQYEAEAQGNREIAQLLAESGEKEIKLLPQLHVSETTLRSKMYGKQYAESHPTKCPDSKIDGNMVEFKTAARKNLSKRILEAAKQADIAVIKTKEVLMRINS